MREAPIHTANFYICEKQHEEMKNSIKSNKEKININKNTLNDLNEKFSDIQPNLIIIDNQNIFNL